MGFMSDLWDTTKKIASEFSTPFRAAWDVLQKWSEVLKQTGEYVNDVVTPGVQAVTEDWFTPDNPNKERSLWQKIWKVIVSDLAVPLVWETAEAVLKFPSFIGDTYQIATDPNKDFGAERSSMKSIVQEKKDWWANTLWAWVDALNEQDGNNYVATLWNQIINSPLTVAVGKTWKIFSWLTKYWDDIIKGVSKIPLIWEYVDDAVRWVEIGSKYIGSLMDNKVVDFIQWKSQRAKPRYDKVDNFFSMPGKFIDQIAEANTLWYANPVKWVKRLWQWVARLWEFADTIPFVGKAWLGKTLTSWWGNWASRFILWPLADVAPVVKSVIKWDIMWAVKDTAWFVGDFITKPFSFRLPRAWQYSVTLESWAWNVVKGVEQWVTSLMFELENGYDPRQFLNATPEQIKAQYDENWVPEDKRLYWEALSKQIESMNNNKLYWMFKVMSDITQITDKFNYPMIAHSNRSTPMVDKTKPNEEEKKETQIDITQNEAAQIIWEAFAGWLLMSSTSKKIEDGDNTSKNSIWIQNALQEASKKYMDEIVWLYWIKNINNNPDIQKKISENIVSMARLYDSVVDEMNAYPSEKVAKLNFWEIMDSAMLKLEKKDQDNINANLYAQAKEYDHKKSLENAWTVAEKTWLTLGKLFKKGTQWLSEWTLGRALLDVEEREFKNLGFWELAVKNPYWWWGNDIAELKLWLVKWAWDIAGIAFVNKFNGRLEWILDKKMSQYLQTRPHLNNSKLAKWIMAWWKETSEEFLESIIDASTEYGNRWQNTSLIEWLALWMLQWWVAWWAGSKTYNETLDEYISNSKNQSTILRNTLWVDIGQIKDPIARKATIKIMEGAAKWAIEMYKEIARTNNWVETAATVYAVWQAKNITQTIWNKLISDFRNDVDSIVDTNWNTDPSKVTRIFWTEENYTNFLKGGTFDFNTNYKSELLQQNKSLIDQSAKLITAYAKIASEVKTMGDFVNRIKPVVSSLWEKITQHVSDDSKPEVPSWNAMFDFSFVSTWQKTVSQRLDLIPSNKKSSTDIWDGEKQSFKPGIGLPWWLLEQKIMESNMPDRKKKDLVDILFNSNTGWLDSPVDYKWNITDIWYEILSQKDFETLDINVQREYRNNVKFDTFKKRAWVLQKAIEQTRGEWVKVKKFAIKTKNWKPSIISGQDIDTIDRESIIWNASDWTATTMDSVINSLLWSKESITMKLDENVAVKMTIDEENKLIINTFDKRINEMEFNQLVIDEIDSVIQLEMDEVVIEELIPKKLWKDWEGNIVTGIPKQIKDIEGIDWTLWFITDQLKDYPVELWSVPVLTNKSFKLETLHNKKFTIDEVKYKAYIAIEWDDAKSRKFATVVLYKEWESIYNPKQELFNYEWETKTASELKIVWVMWADGKPVSENRKIVFSKYDDWNVRMNTTLKTMYLTEAERQSNYKLGNVFRYNGQLHSQNDMIATSNSISIEGIWEFNVSDKGRIEWLSPIPEKLTKQIETFITKVKEDYQEPTELPKKKEKTEIKQFVNAPENKKIDDDLSKEVAEKISETPIANITNWTIESEIILPQWKEEEKIELAKNIDKWGISFSRLSPVHAGIYLRNILDGNYNFEDSVREIVDLYGVDKFDETVLWMLDFVWYSDSEMKDIAAHQKFKDIVAVLTLKNQAVAPDLDGVKEILHNMTIKVWGAYSNDFQSNYENFKWTYTVIRNRIIDLLAEQKWILLPDYKIINTEVYVNGPMGQSSINKYTDQKDIRKLMDNDTITPKAKVEILNAMLGDWTITKAEYSYIMAWLWWYSTNLTYIETLDKASSKVWIWWSIISDIMGEFFPSLNNREMQMVLFKWMLDYWNQWQKKNKSSTSFNTWSRISPKTLWDRVSYEWLPDYLTTTIVEAKNEEWEYILNKKEQKLVNKVIDEIKKDIDNSNKNYYTPEAFDVLSEWYVPEDFIDIEDVKSNIAKIPQKQLYYSYYVMYHKNYDKFIDTAWLLPRKVKKDLVKAFQKNNTKWETSIWIGIWPVIKFLASEKRFAALSSVNKYKVDRQDENILAELGISKEEYDIIIDENNLEYYADNILSRWEFSRYLSDKLSIQGLDYSRSTYLLTDNWQNRYDKKSELWQTGVPINIIKDIDDIRLSEEDETRWVKSLPHINLIIPFWFKTPNDLPEWVRVIEDKNLWYYNGRLFRQEQKKREASVDTFIYRAVSRFWWSLSDLWYIDDDWSNQWISIEDFKNSAIIDPNIFHQIFIPFVWDYLNTEELSTVTLEKIEQQLSKKSIRNALINSDINMWRELINSESPDIMFDNMSKVLNLVLDWDAVIHTNFTSTDIDINSTFHNMYKSLVAWIMNKKENDKQKYTEREANELAQKYTALFGKFVNAHLLKQRESDLQTENTLAAAFTRINLPWKDYDEEKYFKIIDLIKKSWIQPLEVNDDLDDDKYLWDWDPSENPFLLLDKEPIDALDEWMWYWNAFAQTLQDDSYMDLKKSIWKILWVKDFSKKVEPISSDEEKLDAAIKTYSDLFYNFLDKETNINISGLSNVAQTKIEDVWEFDVINSEINAERKLTAVKEWLFKNIQNKPADKIYSEWERKFMNNRLKQYVLWRNIQEVNIDGLSSKKVFPKKWQKNRDFVKWSYDKDEFRTFALWLKQLPLDQREKLIREIIILPWIYDPDTAAAEFEADIISMMENPSQLTSKIEKLLTRWTINSLNPEFKSQAWFLMWVKTLSYKLNKWFNIDNSIFLANSIGNSVASNINNFEKKRKVSKPQKELQQYFKNKKWETINASNNQLIWLDLLIKSYDSGNWVISLAWLAWAGKTTTIAAFLEYVKSKWGLSKVEFRTKKNAAIATLKSAFKPYNFWLIEDWDDRQFKTIDILFKKTPSKNDSDAAYNQSRNVYGLDRDTNGDYLFRGVLPNGKVIIVDEAHASSDAYLRPIIDHLSKSNLVILSWDPRQIWDWEVFEEMVYTNPNPDKSIILTETNRADAWHEDINYANKINAYSQKVLRDSWVAGIVIEWSNSFQSYDPKTIIDRKDLKWTTVEIVFTNESRNKVNAKYRNSTEAIQEWDNIYSLWSNTKWSGFVVNAVSIAKWEWKLWIQSLSVWGDIGNVRYSYKKNKDSSIDVVIYKTRKTTELSEYQLNKISDHFKWTKVNVYTLWFAITAAKWAGMDFDNIIINPDVVETFEYKSQKVFYDALTRAKKKVYYPENSPYIVSISSADAKALANGDNKTFVLKKNISKLTKSEWKTITLPYFQMVSYWTQAEKIIDYMTKNVKGKDTYNKKIVKDFQYSKDYIQTKEWLLDVAMIYDSLVKGWYIPWDGFLNWMVYWWIFEKDWKEIYNPGIINRYSDKRFADNRFDIDKDDILFDNSKWTIAEHIVNVYDNIVFDKLWDVYAGNNDESWSSTSYEDWQWFANLELQGWWYDAIKNTLVNYLENNWITQEDIDADELIATTQQWIEDILNEIWSDLTSQNIVDVVNRALLDQVYRDLNFEWADINITWIQKDMDALLNNPCE